MDYSTKTVSELEEIVELLFRKLSFQEMIQQFKTVNAKIEIVYAELNQRSLIKN